MLLLQICVCVCVRACDAEAMLHETLAYCLDLGGGCF